MPTVFQVRDARQGEIKFRTVMRATYKKMVEVHDKCGQPFRVETVGIGGVPHKRLTLMEDLTCRQADS